MIAVHSEFFTCNRKGPAISKSLCTKVSFFSLSKNACLKNSCKNNATCQTGFTGKGYRCLCTAGFTGCHCKKGMIISLIYKRLRSSSAFEADRKVWLIVFGSAEEFFTPCAAENNGCGPIRI